MEEKPPCQVILTGVDLMTAFAGCGEMFVLDLEEAARVMVSRFCSVVGLPKLVLVDDGSEFKDLIIKTCSVLMIRWYLVTKGNHKAIISKRFHRYLNKVERIHAANCKTVNE